MLNLYSHSNLLSGKALNISPQANHLSNHEVFDSDSLCPKQEPLSAEQSFILFNIANKTLNKTKSL